MVEWPQFWRADKGMMERICPDHSTGHPDPDDLIFHLSNHDHEEVSWAKIHGCCGCCREET
jgi:hypothetical protein